MKATVAVIGAGPAGLVVSRWLLSQGFEPTIFEQGPTLGGQWTAAAGRSGVWPGMHTNTSRILTAFSDLPHDGDLVFPSGRDVLDYLHRYAALFDLESRVRCDTSIETVTRSEKGWLVRHGGTQEAFDRVVVAAGRFHTPAIPDVPGLDSFSGDMGAIASYAYRGPSSYRGKRVLVAGCAVSALEIATELASRGAARVAVTQRRQRYVLPKFVAGVPSDHRMFTRYAALADEALTPSEVDRQLKEIVIESAGSPEQYGAPRPAELLFTAGVTLSQNYLPAVAEGSISVRPWLQSITGTEVTFGDGTVEEFDGIVFGTGFALSLPFLDDEVRAVLNLDAGGFDTDRHTFHPDLPGLAFMGMWDQSGGYFVPLELQARWIAYTWGGVIAKASEADQRVAIGAVHADGVRKTRMNLAAVTFARAAGVEPQLDNWPELRRALLFGPLAPSCFRLEGPDALADAPARFAHEAATFGAITDNELTARERSYWSSVEDALTNGHQTGASK
ncbi:cation diffusion facilitator CzcD-associated flavoprotein CzcO [Mycolicibacterium sp. BK556]|uniref:flavin-containing monooxygenase n=1 Tax=unclassified Mycolicibacterium TaxID=2636767 RepID=UPI0016129534|nr:MULTISPECIES: NAD(P)-binding domain-containing protein [unclassified Mycolicibacterium]MBB3606096.1 cation diffusion facilitator CzcD-associated flavoprotein CzcO [Mycolicibacterium sp. BK556]MBB3632673.1 cation diffusion facilitator CzcD-associated flavoprotein CzcO [Mycolicibacterium sp. BK607]MBB3754022.1 cation diffusion facilitator CzcD-associated flavoprotein CzcO [Mycolicibacterium sp. BK634]